MNITLPESITVAELARVMSVKGSAVMKSLMTFGVQATLNEKLHRDEAVLVAKDLGFTVVEPIDIKTYLLEVMKLKVKLRKFGLFIDVDLDKEGGVKYSVPPFRGQDDYERKVTCSVAAESWEFESGLSELQFIVAELEKKELTRTRAQEVLSTLNKEQLADLSAIKEELLPLLNLVLCQKPDQCTTT